MSNLKVLYGYSWFPSEAYSDIRTMTLQQLERLVAAGFDVEGFCLTLNPPATCLYFQDLDEKWRKGDKTLLQMYESLERALDGKDVFINAPGINLHPGFVEQLGVFTVYQCFDDIDGLNENLTKPAAHAYDLCLTGNIAEVETYKRFGIRNVEWTPMGLLPQTYDPGLSYEDVAHGKRDIDLFMMIDRLSPYGGRKERLDQLASAFPEAHFFGRGWPKGYLPTSEELPYLRRAKIGPNIHLKTGPLNYRTYYLPANGVLQICDNKDGLGKIFELNKEVIGFDTIEECIDLCRYYLQHEEEARNIGSAGWHRAITEYNEVAVFDRNIKIIRKYMNQNSAKPQISNISVSQRRRTIRIRASDAVRRWAGRNVPAPIRPFFRGLSTFVSALRHKTPGSKV